MLKVKQRSWLIPFVDWINKNGPTLQQVAVALHNQVKRGIQQWMAGADEFRQRLAGNTDKVFFKCDAFVTRQYRIAEADFAVSIAYNGRDVPDLISFQFPLVNGTTQ